MFINASATYGKGSKMDERDGKGGWLGKLFQEKFFSRPLDFSQPTEPAFSACTFSAHFGAYSLAFFLGDLGMRPTPNVYSCISSGIFGDRALRARIHTATYFEFSDYF